MSLTKPDCHMLALLMHFVSRVIANISASIVKPREDRPYEGLIYITSEMSTMTSQSYVEGR